MQGLLDLVRAKINQNTARYAEVEAQLAVARQRYAEALLEEASDPSWLRTAPHRWSSRTAPIAHRGVLHLCPYNVSKNGHFDAFLATIVIKEFCERLALIPFFDVAGDPGSRVNSSIF